MEVVIVLGRLLFSSFANVIQKKLSHKQLHPFFIVMSSYLVLSMICLPLISVIDFEVLSRTFWVNIFFAALLDMAGTLFLVMSLAKTDLSVFGPLNAYKVVISMLLAMFFLGEIPSQQGFIGIGIIVVGSCFLIPSSSKNSQNNIATLLLNRGVQYRFLSIFLFSIGTLPLKTAVMAGTAMSTTVFWCLIGFPLAIMSYAGLLKNNITQDLKLAHGHLYSFISLGILIFLMQYMTMLVFSKLLIAYSLALFQLGMVLQVFLGYKIFNEQHIIRRLLACLIMILGSLLILKA